MARSSLGRRSRDFGSDFFARQSAKHECAVERLAAQKV
jgi:hypothetical protein